MTRIVPLLGVDRLVEVTRSVTSAIAPDSFIFLRHGETDGNLNSIYQREDQPLNANGEAQAVAAGRILARERIADIVASPMARAWRTASVAGSHHGIEPRAEHDIRERVFTALFGRPNLDFDWSLDPEGCETLEQFVTRVRRGLANALSAAPTNGHERLVVAHGGVLLVLSAMLEVTLPSELHRNATPLRFRSAGRAWSAERVGA